MEDLRGFIGDWFQANTFTPAWAPHRLRHPSTAFGVAVMIQAIAIGLTALLLQVAPDFSFRGALIIIGVICTALTVGGGPGLIASFSGTFLLEYLLLPPPFSLSLTKGSDVLSVVFYLAVCLATNLAATHAQQRQRTFSRERAAPHRGMLEQRLAVIEADQQRLNALLAQQTTELRATIVESQQATLARIDDLIAARSRVNG